QGNHQIALQNLSDRVSPLGEGLIIAFNNRVNEIEQEVHQSGDRLVTQGTFLAFLALIVSITAIVLSIIIAIFIANNISKPILQVSK
ncbi:hypothetical protein, partial [Pseudomonas sp. 2995-1]|uniref:hypothetical protein n=1 Tax=Pseudomonas sp. 2995-1 TaxID=1712679 RepID=UPI001C457CEB